MSAHGVTPEAYRAKWGLKPDLPDGGACLRGDAKALAIEIGLGRSRPRRRPLRNRSRSADAKLGREQGRLSAPSPGAISLMDDDDGG